MDGRKIEIPDMLSVSEISLFADFSLGVLEERGIVDDYSLRKVLKNWSSVDYGAGDIFGSRFKIKRYMDGEEESRTEFHVMEFILDRGEKPLSASICYDADRMYFLINSCEEFEGYRPLGLGIVDSLNIPQIKVFEQAGIDVVKREFERLRDLD